jgi:predicted RNA-binding Zn-ribbon protein involved in translation (DUF1610 family)
MDETTTPEERKILRFCPQCKSNRVKKVPKEVDTYECSDCKFRGMDFKEVKPHEGDENMSKEAEEVIDEIDEDEI